MSAARAPARQHAEACAHPRGTQHVSLPYLETLSQSEIYTYIYTWHIFTRECDTSNYCGGAQKPGGRAPKKRGGSPSSCLKRPTYAVRPDPSINAPKLGGQLTPCSRRSELNLNKANQTPHSTYWLDFLFFSLLSRSKVRVNLFLQ